MNGCSNRRAVLIAGFVWSMTLSTTARPAGLSEASARLSEVSAASVGATASVVVGGTLSTLGAAGQVVVASVRTVGDATVVVLTGLSDATVATLRIAGSGSEAAAFVVGSVLEVSAVGTGYVLSTAGRVVCFVPERIGTALLHSGRFGGDRRAGADRP